MSITLSHTWLLTTDHPSQPGKAVLVNRTTNEAFGPTDMITPSGLDRQPALHFVKRMVKSVPIDQQRQVLELFR